jgi:hypothetical protein
LRGAGRRAVLNVVSEWRIVEWSRELGRGAIGSRHFARVEFDAARADVDDFALGEEVHVELEGTTPPVRVRRVWPDLPRFRAPPGTAEAPPLDQSLRADAETALRPANGWADARVVFMPGCVRVELDDDAFCYGPSAILDAHEPAYVELPAEFEARFVRLADDKARAYLKTRIELSSQDIAVAFIDDDGRFYFVVASRFSFTRRDPAGALER